MKITITGMKCDQKTLRALEQAATFFASCLMDPRMIRNIVLDIEIHRQYEFLGDCVDDDGGRNPRWFTINLRKQRLAEMIRTLAHEMVHLKQHAKNEFRGVNNPVPTRGKNTSLWRGHPWKPKGREDPYFDSPWEVEAYGREVGLFQRYVQKFGMP